MSKLLTISEVAQRLDRVPHTVRQWERDKRLPKSLMPLRNENGWRMWREDQVVAMKQWMEDVDLRPGKGLDKIKSGQNDT
jgi:DNA-binding transcriptional MerR regulator